MRCSMLQVKSGGRLNVFGPVLELAAAAAAKRSVARKAASAPLAVRNAPNSLPNAKVGSSAAAAAACAAAVHH